VVSGQLEESLRHEIESYIEGRLGGVKQELSALQSQLNESLSQLMDRQSEVQLNGAVAASILEHLRAAHEEGIDLAASESTRAKASSDMAIVKAAITEMSEQQTQADILKILVNRAASFAPRVAFFAIKGEQAAGWRARGFQGTVGDEAIQQISVPVSADSILGDVARSRTTWSGGPHSHSEDHLVLNRLGEEAPQRIVAVPLIVRSRAVAVLYADSAGLDSEAINLEAVETLVRVSGMAVDLLAISRAPAVKKAEEEPAPTTAEQETASSVPTYIPQREYEAKTSAVIEEGSQRAGQSGSQAELAASPAESVYDIQPETIEVGSEAIDSRTEPSAQSDEVPVNPLAAQLPAQPGARRRYGMDVELPVKVDNDDERRLHIEAQRFARLLVSEIKLYNEQKVEEGRSEHDLYPRLREYIDRSREMYDRRVKPEVAQRYDYFHSELVNTLAEGEPEKLGNAYPGATVSA
jgi:hypothetical protein